MRYQDGFTLLELLLSVIILTLIAGFSLPFYVSFQQRNELDTTTNLTVDMLRRAQNYARSGDGDSQWGVATQGGQLTVFKGATYAARDTTEDEAVAIPGSISASGLAEVTFSKLRGIPSTTGSISLASTVNTTRTVTINAMGTVSY